MNEVADRPDLPLLEHPAAIPGVRLLRVVSRLPGLWCTFEATRITDGTPVSGVIVSAALQHAEGYGDRFEREAPRVAAIAQPGLVRVLDAGRSARGLYLVTERPPDKPLLATVDHLQGAETVLTLLKPVAEALDALHAAGLVHAAVCPDTIATEDDAVAKLLPAGLADRHTQEGMIGPDWPPCVAPEAVGGEPPSAPADVFGFAATLWRCLTGGYARRPEGVPEPVIAVLRRALVTEPQLRPARASSLVEELLRLVGEEHGADT